MFHLSETNLSSRSSRARAPRKPKHSQIPYAVLLLAAIIVFGFYLASVNGKLPIYWGFGIVFGYILQHARFCFTAAFRDPFLTGSTSLTRAVLAAVSVGSIGVFAVKLASVLSGATHNISMSNVSPIGIPLILGAVMFGTGMVIAGGCASGTLMRVGEGFTMQMLSLVFFVVGSLWGAHDMNFWGKLNEGAPKVFLPDVFGWFGTVLVQGVIVLLLYIAAVKWQEKKMGSAE